jgi:hypothetical protein
MYTEDKGFQQSLVWNQHPKLLVFPVLNLRSTSFLLGLEMSVLWNGSASLP